MTYTYKYKQMRQAILKRDDYTCAYCGQPGNQIDHIIPISKGGEDHESNMTVACSTCNASKKNQDAQKFQEKRYAKNYTQIKPKSDFLAENRLKVPRQSGSCRTFPACRTCLRWRMCA